MTDSSISDVPTFSDALSSMERAALGLQDALSIFEIANATFLEKEKQTRLIDFLLQAIKAGLLKADGNPDGWEVKSCVVPVPGFYEENPWPRCKPHAGTRITMDIRPGYMSQYAVMRWHGDNCLIQRTDYLALLATPAARGIPAPDWWKASKDEHNLLRQGTMESRKRLIAETAELFLFDRLCIPYMGKQKIKQHLLKKNPKLFTESTFDSAWKTAVEEGTIRMADHEKYARRM